jgi:hypothetical protein
MQAEAVRLSSRVPPTNHGNTAWAISRLTKMHLNLKYVKRLMAHPVYLSGVLFKGGRISTISDRHQELSMYYIFTIRIFGLRLRDERNVMVRTWQCTIITVM